MELVYRGGNCTVTSTKKSKLVIDPTDPKLPEDAVVLFSYKPAFDLKGRVFEGPGEYETDDIAVRGISASVVGSEEGSSDVTMYAVGIEGYRMAFLGVVALPLSEKQLEMLNMIDILCVPVGGGASAYDITKTVSLVKQIGPKLVVALADSSDPDSKLVASAIAADLAIESEEQSKLKLKPAQQLDASLRLVVLTS